MCVCVCANNGTLSNFAGCLLRPVSLLHLSLEVCLSGDHQLLHALHLTVEGSLLPI